MKDARYRLDLVATRAIADFRSADSIERRLQSQGNTLHPTLAALRARIESALDQAESAIGMDDLDTAREATVRAESLVDRFEQDLGGA